ncbi:hypothetical protein GCM10007890_23910 [Methylobacterium tardum]|uniref:YqaE/Pmp3 family membrane protein n=2 Tax=Methylobacteriaceae TaxID=119045 RepID=A0AA37WTY2_9HYPH|nr:hypothetical protein GCM10007890_23910 [Methylobacterium tardum]
MLIQVQLHPEGYRKPARRLCHPRQGAVPTMIMILICFLAPWLAMFLRGKVFQGILCILLHLTIIGWIPATIWALIVTRREAA